MVNSRVLINYIFNSGLTVAEITKALGITEMGFLRRIANLRDFKPEEVTKLRKILMIDDDVTIQLYIPKEV